MRTLVGNFTAICICLGALGLSLAPSSCSGDAGGSSTGDGGGGSAGQTGGDDGGSAAQGDDDGTSATDGGTGGKAKDGGTHQDAGSHGDGGGGGGGGPGPECTALQACCDDLGSQLQSGCMQIVGSGYESSCSSALSSYHSGGYCTGGTHCATLATCCPSLPPGQGWQDTCNYYVDLNNDPQCESLYGTYQTDGYCN